MVTGASSGIGAHLAATLHEAGASVVLCARRADRLEGLVAELNRRCEGSSGDATTQRAFAVAMDVAEPASIVRGFDAAESLFSGSPCDIIVNCAGVAITKRAIDTSDKDYEDLMAVNQRGAFQVAREASKRLVQAGTHGSIINIASIMAFRQQKQQATYGMSKAALVQMTKIMALELVKNNVRLNCIAPGYFLTEINEDFFSSDVGKARAKQLPGGRLGELHELDATLLLLASEKASSFITGAVMTVDGGHMVSSL